MSNCFRILANNYLESTAAKSVSSENVDFPVSNIYDKYRRNKVWRSAGYWDLSSINKTIVFRETVGVDLTATVAANSYTTDAAFLSAIKTALDAVGAATYTVTRDTTTKKIKITSDLTGGASVFELRMATSVDMANVLGFDTVNLSGASTYTADELKIHTYEFIKWDLGMASMPQAFVLAGPRNTPLKFSSNAVIKLQGNQTDNWSSPTYNQTLTQDDYVYFIHDADKLSQSGLRYWRLYIEDKNNPNLYVEAGLIYLGESFAFDRGGPEYGFTTEYNDRSNTVFSENGVEFTDVRPVSETLKMNLVGLTKTGMENLDDFFNRLGLHTPFWLSVDTNAVFSSSQRRWVRYVKFDSNISSELQSINNFRVSADFREQL